MLIFVKSGFYFVIPK